MKRSNSLWLPAIVAAAIFFAVGCKSPTGGTGLDVLPDGDQIGLSFTDSSTIEMETLWDDSFNTSKASRQLFGNYADPEFGTITAGTYTEILARSGLDFGDATNLIFDSIVFRLNIDGSYGRLESPQTLVIHELLENVPERDTIYSSESLAYDDSWNIAQDRQIDFSETGQVDIFTVTLDPRFGERILFADPDTLGDKDLFTQLVKGFYISTKEVKYFSREPGAIFSFFAASTSSQLELYYQKRDSANGEFVPNMEPFLISLSTPKFHSFTRTNYSEKLLSQIQIAPNTLDENTFYEFSQGAGIKNFIKFPNVDKMEEVLVSRADLIVYVEDDFLGSNRRFQPPFQLESVFASEDKEEVVINGTRILISNPAQYDEELGAYVLSMTNYVQELISKRRSNNGFFLVANNRTFQVNRAVFGGTGHPTLKPVLQITYTNLPK